MANDEVGGAKASPTGGHFYALYECSSIKVLPGSSELTPADFGLILLSSNLPSPAEIEIQKVLVRRLSKSQVYSNQGNVVSASIGLLEDWEKTSECYICASTPVHSGSGDKALDNSSTQYILSFVSQTEHSLDLFRHELDYFTFNVFKQLQSKNEVTVAMRESLEIWHELSVEYIDRCVKALKENVKYLVHAALMDKKLVISGGNTKIQTDLERFYRTCSLSEILEQLRESRHCQDAGSLSGSVDMLLDTSDCEPASKNGENTITVFITDDSIKIDLKEYNMFCEEWAQILNKPSTDSHAKLKNVIDVFKLKFIQNMNLLKRLLREAEKDFYALFRAYVFLQKSGNSEILLHYVTQDAQPETASVLKVLQDFIRETDLKRNAS